MNVQPYAVVTINLPRPMTGSEIAEVVNLTSTGTYGYDKYYTESRYRDGDQIGFGRTSQMPDENISVRPSEDTEWFDLQRKYEQVVVVDDASHAHSFFCIGYEDEVAAHVSTVKRFASKLSDALGA